MPIYRQAKNNILSKQDVIKNELKKGLSKYQVWKKLKAEGVITCGKTAFYDVINSLKIEYQEITSEATTLEVTKASLAHDDTPRANDADVSESQQTTVNSQTQSKSKIEVNSWKYDPRARLAPDDL